MSTPSREDATLTDAERETYRCPVNDAAGEHYHIADVERIVAAHVAAARDAGARAVAATRWCCPVHGIPDCSPLLNGCSIPNHIANAVARAINHTED